MKRILISIFIALMSACAAGNAMAEANQINLSGTAENGETVLNISKDKETEGTLISAFYKNGRLIFVKEAEDEMTVKPPQDAESMKVLIWDSGSGMKPVCESLNLTKSEWEDAAKPTLQPTVQPTLQPTVQPTIQPTMQPADGTQIMKLDGEWQLELSEYSDGMSLSDSCVLPGTLDENQKGKKNTRSETGKLTRKYTYTGKAVYRKTVEVPADWNGKSISLYLERTKKTRVWVNGTEETAADTDNSLAAPHIYELTNIIPGQTNTIDIEVDNSNYSLYMGNGNETRATKTHMLTEETQTNWNGVIGKLELHADERVYIKNMLVYPDTDNKLAKIKLYVQNNTENNVSAKIETAAKSLSENGETLPAANEIYDIAPGEQVIEYSYSMGENPLLWSEFHPNMYELTSKLTFNGISESFKTSFGMRSFGTSGTQFTNNGKYVFLRGEANSAVFPVNGYPYMTKEEWKEFFAKAQELGINFFRFHTWTPPEAAFEAADEMGIYMQPELYGFGGSPEFSGYFTDEAYRILKHLANHPSFVMMAFGNEMSLDGKSAEDEVKVLREKCRDFDSTRLYSEGSNDDFNNAQFTEGDDYWTTAKIKKPSAGEASDKYNIRMAFSWNNDAKGGFLEGMQPNTVKDFSEAIKESGVTKPVLGHETAQFQTYPMYDEQIEKYSQGIFEAKNLQKWKSTMQSKGLLDMNEKFARASGASAAVQNRAEIEAAMRTPEFGGYEILSIQDFPGQDTALVGLLDAFMDDKPGGFKKEEYKSINSAVTVLAKLPKMMYDGDEDFSADIVFTNYSEQDLNASAEWSVRDENGNVIDSGAFDEVTAKQGSVANMGTVSLKAPFKDINKAQKLIFTVKAAGSENSYDIWVYTNEKAENDGSVLVAGAYTDEVRKALADGKKVLMLMPGDKTSLPNSVSVRWTNDYWSTMFHGRVEDAAYTVGMYVDENHPVFNDFPTEYFGDYQWYNLMKSSRAVILDDAPAELNIMAQNIDHMKYSRRLGSIFEAKVDNGKLLVCTMDILNNMEKYPEVRQMYNSLLEYAQSQEFDPQCELTYDYLRTIFKQTANENGEFSPYETISGLNYSSAETAGELVGKSGTDSNGNTVSDAVGGITAGDTLKYENVNFSGNGTTEIEITGANYASGGEDAVIEIYLESANGTKLGEVNIPNTGSEESFTSVKAEVPHIMGTHNIVFKFKNDETVFAGFKFTEDDKTYRDPYTLIDPSNTGDAAVEFEADGGTYSVEQLTVRIDGKVNCTIQNCDFGFSGSDMLILGGSVIDGDTVNAVLSYNEEGEEIEIPIQFINSGDETYQLESGTTSGMTFYKNKIELGRKLTGVHDITITFDEDTSLELADIQFAKAGSQAKTWDFTKISGSKITMDSIENGIYEYDGIIIRGSGANDYIDSSNGVYYNGKSSTSNGEGNRYIAFNAESDGILKVTAKRAYSNGSLYVSQSISLSNGKTIPNLTNPSSFTEGEIEVKAGNTYYLYCVKTGMCVKSVEFVPENN